MKRDTKYQITWTILETLVRLMILIGVILILSEYVRTALLFLMILLAIWWILHPIKGIVYFYREDKPKKRKKK